MCMQCTHAKKTYASTETTRPVMLSPNLLDTRPDVFKTRPPQHSLALRYRLSFARGNM